MKIALEGQTPVTVHSHHGLPTPPESTGLDNFSNEKGILDLLPPTPTDDIDEQRLDIKLQFSRLEQTIGDVSMLDDRGYWNGRPEDEPLRLELQEISLKLQRMLTRPIDTIQAVAQGHHSQACLRYAVHHNIAQQVPVDGSITYADLAVQASVHEGQCRRIVRLLMSQHVFSETPSGELCHTPASLQLLDPGICAWVDYQTTDSLRSSTQLTEALARWPGSLNKSETAYSLAHETELPMFEHFARTGKIERFRKAMSGNAHQPCFGTNHVISGYDWQELSESRETAPVVVDVGGGIGHVASAISDAFPSLDVRVQDIGVASTYRKKGVEFSRYDFFGAQPITGADVYLMRQILHDWSDEYAVHILRNQIAAMGSQSKLIIMDMILQRPGEWTLSEERKSRMTDITMLTLFNAKEREMSEWTELVKKASDSRLSLSHLARPTGSLLSIMEFSFA